MKRFKKTRREISTTTKIFVTCFLLYFIKNVLSS